MQPSLDQAKDAWLDQLERLKDKILRGPEVAAADLDRRLVVHRNSALDIVHELLLSICGVVARVLLLDVHVQDT